MSVRLAPGAHKVLEGCRSGQTGWFRQPKADPPRAEKPMYYVYILKSEVSGRLYRGSCKDLRNRVENHNGGKVKSTKIGKPWKLIYYEAFENKTDALREEKFLKSGKGRERIKFLFNE